MSLQSFNEAAINRSRKLVKAAVSASDTTCFNEAAINRSRKSAC